MVGTLFYPDGHVDKGIWLGDHLIRLLFNIPEAGPGYQDTDELDTPDLKSRGTTAPKGPLERESHRLIQAAANGDSMRIEILIQTGNVYINVVDRLVLLYGGVFTSIAITRDNLYPLWFYLPALLWLLTSHICTIRIPISNPDWKMSLWSKYSC